MASGTTHNDADDSEGTIATDSVIGFDHVAGGGRRAGRPKDLLRAAELELEQVA